MNAPRTPAPWVIEDSCIKGPHRCVARLDWSIRDAVDDANARLIAAAPELLEALALQNEWVRAALECKGWHWDGDQREAAEWSLEQARKAVAKAEGDAP